MERRTAGGEEIAAYVDVTTAENQSATLRHQDLVWPVRAIRRGAAVRSLAAHGRSLEGLGYELGGARFGVGEFMARRRTGGLLVLKDGEVALERYGMGHGAESLWTGFATATSITGTLCGAALREGAIASLDDPCEAYVPQLVGSAYEGVTIRNVLRMCSGVAWREEAGAGGEAGGRSDVHRLGRAMVSRRPGAVLDLMCRLERAHPQGEVFNYSTGESHVLAAVVAGAVGRPLADYFGERVWGPAGMEADAHWQLDCEDGLELGGLGVSARLRDVGRFGLFVLKDGVTPDGRRVLPPGWRDLAGRPDCAATAFGRLRPGDPGGYGYHWWAAPPVPGVHDGLFSANGAYGQLIYVNPGERVVVVIQGAWRAPADPEASVETVALIRAAVRALRSL